MNSRGQNPIKYFQVFEIEKTGGQTSNMIEFTSTSSSTHNQYIYENKKNLIEHKFGEWAGTNCVSAHSFLIDHVWFFRRDSNKMCYILLLDTSASPPDFHVEFLELMEIYLYLSLANPDNMVPIPSSITGHLALLFHPRFSFFFKWRSLAPWQLTPDHRVDRARLSKQT